MKNDVDKIFLKVKVEDTRCPELIREAGVTDKYIYLLRNRTECGDWKHIGHLFVQIKGACILTQPVSARRYFTTQPEKVVDIMKRQKILF